MRAKAKLLLFAIFVVPISVARCSGQAQTKEHCLTYEPTVSKLIGKLTQETFPGPPNYKSIQNGDKPETEWIISLDNPVCVEASKTDPDLNPARSEVGRIQLVFLDRAAYAKYKQLLSKRIVATGSLFGRHTGHHHTDVLIIVKSLEKEWSRAECG